MEATPVTTIEWAHAGLGRGESWNPIRAQRVENIAGVDPGDFRDATAIGWHCEKVSPACANCYAERQNMAGARGGTKYPYKPGHRKSGHIQVYLDEKTLLAPPRWKQPRGIFACSMTDAFGDWVLNEWLDKIFAVAALCPQHILIILTKRSERMRAYFNGPYPDGNGVAARIADQTTFLAPDRKQLPEPPVLIELPIGPRRADGEPELGFRRMFAAKAWPLPNVWLGCTAEDQERADERREDMCALAAQGWTTIVSYEPALGPIDWTQWGFVDQIIFGGETGPHARPPHPQWARDTRDFCAAHHIAYFHKQWGEFSPHEIRHDGEIVPPMPAFGSPKNFYRWRDGAYVPVDGREDCKTAFAPGQITLRVGRARAGRLLDGREHDDFPGMES
jgi:protein gp37